MGERRAELAEQATDYVLEHGLIGLSLRPLAAALGTSDRMLLYHFQDKNDLVVAVLRTSIDRSLDGIRALPASADVRRAVLDLWSLMSTPELARCQRLYVEVAALGVLGAEPYAAMLGAANQEWLAALGAHLEASGVPGRSALRAAALVEAAFMGLQLDEAIAEPDQVAASVADLADAVAGLWGRAAAE